jgi:hypothetical protein
MIERFDFRREGRLRNCFPSVLMMEQGGEQEPRETGSEALPMPGL